MTACPDTDRTSRQYLCKGWLSACPRVPPVRASASTAEVSISRARAESRLLRCTSSGVNRPASAVSATRSRRRRAASICPAAGAGCGAVEQGQGRVECAERSPQRGGDEGEAVDGQGGCVAAVPFRGAPLHGVFAKTGAVVGDEGVVDDDVVASRPAHAQGVPR